MTTISVRPLSACHLRFLSSLLVALMLGTAAAQTPDQKPAAPVENPDASVVGAEPAKPLTPEQLRTKAWSMLETTVADDKHAEAEVQALAALGLMGRNTRSLGLIRTALSNKDIDVRIAAVLAAGQTMSPNMTSDLRRALDDKEPGVAFTAALTLWKMHDRSGEDILTAVADGDRKTSSTFVNGTEHSLNKELHDPTAMAKFGAMQGASMLLGPFGYGITAYEYLHKNGGDGARVQAIDAIAQNHTKPIHAELLGALGDKDLGVRAAAAKALARYHDADVPPALSKLFYDPKAPVRLTAAAAYLVSSGVAPGSPLPPDPGAHAAKP